MKIQLLEYEKNPIENFLPLGMEVFLTLVYLPQRHCNKNYLMHVITNNTKAPKGAFLCLKSLLNHFTQANLMRSILICGHARIVFISRLQNVVSDSICTYPVLAKQTKITV